MAMANGDLAIRVECRCGQAFAAAPQFRGHSVPCPVCGQLLQIPHSSSGGTRPTYSNPTAYLTAPNASSAMPWGVKLAAATALLVLVGLLFAAAAGYALKGSPLASQDQNSSLPEKLANALPALSQTSPPDDGSPTPCLLPVRGAIARGIDSSYEIWLPNLSLSGSTHRQDSAGRKLTRYSHRIKSEDPRVVEIDFFDDRYPNTNGSLLADFERDSHAELVAEFGAEDISRRPLQMGNYKGFELKTAGRANKPGVTIRCYQLDKCVLIQRVKFVSGSEPVEDVECFLESLRLTSPGKCLRLGSKLEAEYAAKPDLTLIPLAKPPIPVPGSGRIWVSMNQECEAWIPNADGPQPFHVRVIPSPAPLSFENGKLREPKYVARSMIYQEDRRKPQVQHYGIREYLFESTADCEAVLAKPTLVVAWINGYSHCSNEKTTPTVSLGGMKTFDFSCTISLANGNSQSQTGRIIAFRNGIYVLGWSPESPVVERELFLNSFRIRPPTGPFLGGTRL